MKIKVAIAEDMPILLRSLSLLVDTFDNFVTTIEAINGQDLINKLEKAKDLPEILLLDVNMPVMNGIKTAQAIKEKYPWIKIIALSTHDDDLTIINMIKAGCCSYLLKDITPAEFNKGLCTVHSLGYYYADNGNNKFRKFISQPDKIDTWILTEKEINFLQLACSDLTYKQIASKMNVSEKSVHGYREGVFEKLGVQSRVGMAIVAINNKIISFPNPL